MISRTIVVLSSILVFLLVAGQAAAQLICCGQAPGNAPSCGANQTLCGHFPTGGGCPASFADCGPVPPNFCNRFGQCVYSHPLGLDDFKCHKVKDLKQPKFLKTTVSLDDQFGPDAMLEVKRPFMICNPADKSGRGLFNPDAHLCCYKVKGAKFTVAKEVEITDDFGTLRLGKIKKPRLLCTPCSKTEL